MDLFAGESKNADNMRNMCYSNLDFTENFVTNISMNKLRNDHL